MSKWQDNQKKSSFDWRKKVGALIQAKTAELQKLTESERHRLENLQGLLLACPPKTDPFAMLGFGSKTC